MSHQSVRILTSQMFDHLDDLTFQLAKLAEALPTTINELNNYTPDEQKRLIERKMHIQNACTYIRKTIMNLPQNTGGNA